jgi:hypothetical protein
MAGLQFMYMFYLERIDRERKRRIQELERECRYLRGDLLEAESRIAHQENLIAEMTETIDDPEEEIWADVIEDR